MLTIDVTTAAWQTLGLLVITRESEEAFAFGGMREAYWGKLAVEKSRGRDCSKRLQCGSQRTGERKRSESAQYGHEGMVHISFSFVDRVALKIRLLHVYLIGIVSM